MFKKNRKIFLGHFAECNSHLIRPNENKMSDGGRDRALLAVEMWKSSQKWSVQRSAVRSIAWLGLSRLLRNDCVAWDRIVRTKVSLLVWWQLIRVVGTVQSPDDKIDTRLVRVIGSGMWEKRSMKA